MLVRDLRLGPGSPFVNTTALVSFSHHVVFASDDGIHGEELWRSDGTFGGTWLVKSIHNGGSSSPREITVDLPNQLAYFAADDGASGPEPWVTDGWPPLTVALDNIETNRVGGSARVGEIVDVFGTAFFRADDGLRGSELWKLDAQGNPVLVKDIAPGDPSSNPTHFTSFGGSLYFVADDGSSGEELWKSDGTSAGTTLVRDVAPGLDGAKPRDLAVAGAWLYFAADDRSSGRELWRTDGTTAGTTRVIDLEPGPAGAAIEFLTAMGDDIYFRAGALGTGGELWRSDGTAAGTEQVKDIWPGASGSGPTQLTAVGNRLFFTARNAGIGRELYVSDGTEPGTVLVKDIRPGSLGSNPSQLTAFDGRVLFTADDGAFGVEPWASDGTTAGTDRIIDIETGLGSSNPRHLTASADWVGFSAAGQLWRSDGTAAGTTPIVAATNVTNLWSAGSRHVYWSGTGLSRTDGTAAGSRLVYTGNLNAAQITLSAGELLLAGSHPATGTAQLFTTDPGATAQVVGVSCAAPGTAPTLRSDDPVLGGLVVVDGDGAPPGAAGVVLFDLPSPPLAIGPAPCALYVRSLSVLATFNVVTPTWSLAFPSPTSPPSPGFGSDCRESSARPARRSAPTSPRASSGRWDTEAALG